MMTDRMPVVLDVRVVTGAGGGPEKTILNSPRYLKSAGYRMLCAYMHPPGDPGFARIEQRARNLEAPLLSIPDRGPVDLAVLRELARVCRQERVAIWHAHDYKSNLFGLLLKPFWPMRLVTTVHGWVERTRRTPLYYAVDRLSLPRYERVLCVSNDLRERCLALGVRAARCLRVENGIDPGPYTRHVAAPEAKRRLGFDPNRLLVGAVGRLSAEKGFDLLIRAARQLLGSGPDFDLVIAGEGGQRAELESLVDRLGLRGRVRLLGFREDTVALYEAMDLYALSSLREGLPNSLLEAMAMGIPAVATRIAGVPRLIRHGENGWLIEPGSVDDLAGSLARLLGDPALRAALGSGGRRTVETEYSFEARMRKVQAVYDELLGRAAAPAPDRSDRPGCGCRT